MTDLITAREAALGLPEATEADHHGMNSFRVRNKIFATVPDDDHIRLMLEPEQITAAVAQFPVSAQQFYWGRRLAALVVTLADIDAEDLRDLICDAWRRKAPASLVRGYDAQH